MPTDSSLVSLEDLITGTRPERSLMMTYCGDLAYVERVLLPDLQQEGDAAVTLLIDRNQYEASFAQLTGISGPGVRYQLHPVRLPNPHAAFHPKLYCHCRSGSAVLIVASANLTFYGARTNAEVVDRLVLDDQGQDVGAFQSYLELLESLPSLDESIPLAALSAIEAQAVMIRTLLPANSATNEQGPLFLHNVAVPLLEQIAAHVPPKDVRQITVFSPFFDPGSLAINALAKAYPRAKLTIIKRGEHADDFNGGALSAISSRLQVKELSTLEGKRRRLHAKIAVFQGPRATWIVSGSANLTAPAWLKSTRDGGNVEAVTLRRAASSKEAERLLASAGTKSIDWRKLAYAVVPDSLSSSEHSPCDVREAELRGTSVRLKCDARTWGAELPSFRLTIEDHYGCELVAARCSKREGNLAELVADLGNSPVVMRDGPVIVQLEVVHGDGRRETGRVWLSRPDYLGMGAKERELYRAKEAFDRFRPTSGQWELLAEGWVSFIGSMHERWQGRMSSNVAPAQDMATASQTAPTSNRIIERPIRPEDLAVDESTIVLSSAGGRGTSSGLFRELFANVQRLFFDEDKGVTPVSTSGGHTTVRDASADELEEDTLDEGVEGEPVPPLERGAVTSVTQQLDALWRVVSSTAVGAGRVEDVVGILEHSVGSFLLPLYLQVTATQSAGTAVVIESMRHAWASAVSLHGLAEGRPQGWLIRAWADAGTRGPLDAALSSPDRCGRLLALLAAAAVARTDNGALLPWQGEDNVTSGLLLLLRGANPAVSAELTESAQKSMEQVAVRSESLLPIADLVSAVHDNGSEDLAIVRAARRWSTIARLTLMDDGHKDVSALERTLAAEDNGLLTTYRSVRRRFCPAVVPPIPVGESLSCGGCNTQLSTVRAERLRRVDAGPDVCESCGRLLVPFDFRNGITRVVLEALAPGVRFTLDLSE